MDATREAFRKRPQEPAHDTTHAENERRYSLYLVERPAGFYWRLSNCGVTLSGARIAWTADGIDRDYGLDEIRSIRLQHATGGGRHAIGICLIRFTDGRVLTVYGSNDRGFTDAAQAEIYSAFVRDLHRRIPDEAAARITFNAGLSSTRYLVVSVASAALHRAGKGNDARSGRARGRRVFLLAALEDVGERSPPTLLPARPAGGPPRLRASPCHGFAKMARS